MQAKFYCWESVNNTAIPFNTFAQARAFLVRVIPLADVRGNADSANTYAEARGWTCGSAAMLEAEIGELDADWEYTSAQAVEQSYAELRYTDALYAD